MTEYLCVVEAERIRRWVVSVEANDAAEARQKFYDRHEDCVTLDDYSTNSRDFKTQVTKVLDASAGGRDANDSCHDLLGADDFQIQLASWITV